jgi:cyclohexyl-isocyanide hydratase
MSVSEPSATVANDTVTIGFLAFPGVTALDLVGPYEVLARLPITTVIVAANREPVRTDRGLQLIPDVGFDDCPPLDVLVVPGGPGQTRACQDEALLSFVRDRCEAARTVASICTGALIVAAAGPLQGRRAATHWLARAELSRMGAIPIAQRVVRDGKFLSSGGVSAGIDSALTLAAELMGPEAAQSIQLSIEYDPAPPFTAGSPTTAPAHIVDRLRAASRFQQ